MTKVFWRCRTDIPKFPEYFPHSANIHRPRLVLFSTFLNRALYHLRVPETRENLQNLRIYCSVSNEETEITHLYGQHAWSRTLPSYRDYFKNRDSSVDRYVVFIFYFDSQPVLGNPTDVTSSIIWDREKHRQTTPQPNSTPSTLAQLAPDLIVKSSKVADDYAERYRLHSSVLGSQLDLVWGDYKTALRQRHQGLTDLLQLLRMSPQSTQHFRWDDISLNDDTWSDIYIRKAAREYAARVGDTTDWSLLRYALNFSRTYWWGSRFGGQFVEIDRALKHLKSVSENTTFEGPTKRILLITPTLGSAMFVWAYYRQKANRFSNPILYDSELKDAQKQHIIDDIDSNGKGKIRILVIPAEEFVKTTFSMYGVSSIFITGPLQEKALYAQVWDRARSLEPGSASVVPELLIVEDAPIDRVLMAEEYAGRSLWANPFSNTTQPLLIEETTQDVSNVSSESG